MHADNLPCPSLMAILEYAYLIRLANPYAFRLSKTAEITPRVHDGEQYWIDIHYPTINITVHCTYKPIHGNLRALSHDAQEFLYNHSTRSEM